MNGISVQRDVPYLGPDRDETMDIYVPDAATHGRPAPAAVIIHGGGWFSQRKDGRRETRIAQDLASHGYVCASIDYRLVNLERPETASAVWPMNVEDCERAVAFLRSNAAEFRVDRRFIATIGGSAGGHLSCLVAYKRRQHLPQPETGATETGLYSVQAVVCLYGVGDPAGWLSRAPVRRKGMDALELMLGGVPHEVPDSYHAFSPVQQIASDSPPTLLIHGTADQVISYRESQLFFDALQQAGVPSELILVEGAGHSFDLQPPERDLRPEVFRFIDDVRDKVTNNGQ
jgi:acetyl esterase/lipase